MAAPDTVFGQSTPRGHTAFAYVIEGRGYFCSDKQPFAYEIEGENYFDMARRDPRPGDESLILFADGDRIEVSTGSDPLRFLSCSGKPLHEPVAWYGPIVMNTREELRIAFEEYHNNTFHKHV